MIAELSNHLAESLLAKAAIEAPHEACGLLLGAVIGDMVTVEDVVYSENMTNGDPRTAFEIDPSLHLLLQKAARAGGSSIIGVWHSHPTSSARPSQQDARRSLEKGWLWLITGREQDVWKTHAFFAGETDAKVFESLQIQAV